MEKTILFDKNKINWVIKGTHRFTGWQKTSTNPGYKTCITNIFALCSQINLKKKLVANNFGTNFGLFHHTTSFKKKISVNRLTVSEVRKTNHTFPG